MRESPRIRRLRSDFKALQQLREDSTIIDFTPYGEIPEAYTVRFFGRGFWKADGSDDVLVRETHEVTIGLGASYPRMIPDLSWQTPIFHPNISGSGVVCLGGYGTHWVPAVRIDELCHMLWDMIRYRNYDVESPYNREAALWAKTQTHYHLPIDDRPLRNKVSGVDPNPKSTPKPGVDVMFLEDPGSNNASNANAEIVDAELVEQDNNDGILFID